MKKHALILTAISFLAASNAHSSRYWIYSQHAATNSPPIRYSSSQPITYDSLSFNSYGNGNISSIPNWNVGDFTGLAIPNRERHIFERSHTPGWYGSTAIQLYDRYAGIQLHTYSSIGDPRTLKTINFGIDFSNNWKIKPWGDFDSNAKYCVANFAAIPHSYTAEGAAGYLIARIFLKDEATNKSIAFGAVIWDSRPTPQTEWILEDTNWSGATNSVVANSIYSHNTEYVTLMDYSNLTQASSNWSDDRWYGYCITSQNINNVKNKIAANGGYLNIDPSRLVVTSTGFEFEMATEIGGQIKNGWAAARFREFNIFVDH